MKKIRSLLMALSFVIAVTAAFAFTTSSDPCEGTARKHYTGTFSDPNLDPNAVTLMLDVQEGYNCISPSDVCTYYFDGQSWLPCPDEPEGTYEDPL